ncbi:type IV toxin-antitoxin system AbiEi family antitoxin [Cellulomonas oligotrophica]|uniref:Uncharacterized protein n=1 Tax=Cellulomonas oligotrophica TaxID=931536 RepID=A0A7Y9JYL9_9CELL|nr:type IV toxin-antitoxin system AbiEi family antitoxin [Cellulomonas oligotrophica]NYD85909.1 hypothetical protein [Cellulomonas oligotrophica]
MDDARFDGSLPHRLDGVRSALRRYGVELEVHGDLATLRVDDALLERRWRWVEQHAEPDQDGTDGDRWLLLADRIPPARAASARDRGDWYADTAGRAFVRARGVLVDIRDRSGPAARPRRPGAPRAALNPMSPKRAQVVCMMLEEPGLVSASIRTIAERSGVSVGIVQQVLADLGERRFLLHGRTALNRVAELLDQWTAAFASGLGAHLELGRFSGDAQHLGPWSTDGRAVYVSGEAASDELRGPDATFYVAQLDMSAVIASRWRPDGSNPNIVVRRQFWLDPRREAGVHDAPATLRLADLLITDDPRHRLASVPLREMILDRHAR